MKIKRKEIGQFIIDDVNVADSFLNYDKRDKEDKFILNKYLGSPTPVNSFKYLLYSFSTTINYLKYFKKLINARFKSKKNIVLLNLLHGLMIFLSFINFLLGIFVNIFTQFFRIPIFLLEFICAPIVYLMLMCTSNNYGTIKNHYKYIINRFIGREKLDNNTNIIRLLISGVYGIKIIDLFKNFIRKINNKHQLEIAEKTIRKYNKNKAKSGNITKLKRRRNRRKQNEQNKVKKTKEEKIKINKLLNAKRKLKSEYYDIYFKKIEKDMTKISSNIVHSVVKTCDTGSNLNENQKIEFDNN